MIGLTTPSGSDVFVRVDAIVVLRRSLPSEGAGAHATIQFVSGAQLFVAETVAEVLGKMEKG